MANTKTNKQTKANNQTKAKDEPKTESTLYTIYGARYSKSGERINVSLVTGKDANKSWACTSIKIDNPDGRVQCKIVNNEFVYVKIPLLVEDESKKDTLDF